MRFILFIIIVSMLASCQSTPRQKEPFLSLLKNCNEVNIVFYNGGDTLHFKTNDSSGVRILTQSINGVKQSLADTCAAMGELHFMQQDSILLNASFAIKQEKGQLLCNVVRYDFAGAHYQEKFSEKAGNLLLQLAPK